jgi:hypothetical protein
MGQGGARWPASAAIEISCGQGASFCEGKLVEKAAAIEQKKKRLEPPKLFVSKT